jgi:hypothetical protein
MAGIPDNLKPSLFFEQYDLEPLFDPSEAAELRGHSPFSPKPPDSPKA